MMKMFIGLLLMVNLLVAGNVLFAFQKRRGWLPAAWLAAASLWFGSFLIWLIILVGEPNQSRFLEDLFLTIPLLLCGALSVIVLLEQIWNRTKWSRELKIVMSVLIPVLWFSFLINENYFVFQALLIIVAAMLLHLQNSLVFISEGER